MLRINDEAPNFTAETSQGTINFHEWIGDGWAILFSHPKDFTPVCTTELGYMAGLQPEFEKRNCKIIGLSVDPVSSHSKWAADIEETQGHKVRYPMIGDPELNVAKLYDMLPADAGNTSEGRTAATNATVRTVFVVGPDKKDQADAQLSHEHRPQLRRSAARPRFDATHGQAQSGHAGELETGRRRDYSPGGFGRRGEAKVSWRLEGPQALPPDRSSAELAACKRGRCGMILKQFYLPCLAHASYMIGDEETGTAAVVDPQRDTDQYIAFAAEHALTIKHVLLTHLHADFVAGHLELRDRVGARIYLGAAAKAAYAFTPLRDGDTLEFGRVRLKISGNAGPHSRIDLHRRLRSQGEPHATPCRAHRRHAVHRRRRASRSARGAGMVGC